MCGLEIKNGNVYKMEKKLHIQIYLGHMIQVNWMSLFDKKIDLSWKKETLH